jgi:CBS domain-containing protein
MTKTHTLEARARDLMNRDIVRLDSDTSIAGAVDTLEANGISGAPVVDASERLVGVFSLRDAARSEALNAGRLGTRRGDDRVPDWSEEEGEDGFVLEDEISDRDDYSTAAGGGDTVSEWMNPTVIAVAPDATLKEVCKVMAREKIHRVFVVDGRRLSGVISSLDIVQYLSGKL